MGPKPDDRCSTCGAAGTRGEAVAFHTPRPPRPRGGRPGRGRPQPEGEHSLPTPLSRRPAPGRGWGHSSVREPPPPQHLLWQPPAERTAVVRPDAGAGPRPGHCPQGQRPRQMDKTAPPPTHALRQDRAVAPERTVQHGAQGGPVSEPREGPPGSSVLEAGCCGHTRRAGVGAPEPPPDRPSSLDGRCLPGDGPAPEPRRPRSACPAPRARVPVTQVRCPCRADAPGYSAALPTDTENGGERGWGAGRTTMGCTGRGLGAGRDPRRAEGGGPGKDTPYAVNFHTCGSSGMKMRKTAPPSTRKMAQDSTCSGCSGRDQPLALGTRGGGGRLTILSTLSEEPGLGALTQQSICKTRSDVAAAGPGRPPASWGEPRGRGTPEALSASPPKARPGDRLPESSVSVLLGQGALCHPGAGAGRAPWPLPASWVPEPP